MRLESAFAINLRIGISVLLGAVAALAFCLLTAHGFMDGLPLGWLVAAGALLGSYVVVPARVDRNRS
ncbi:MAG: hypothetical protein BGP10_04585 [Rhodanobacter sp. 68-29]|nr:hypothetical protein [Rhodanobacter sp.]OJY61784.1 MAG: hypothetical protein BGP10_04585 [Rhodanobacter sp. 68-29]